MNIMLIEPLERVLERGDRGVKVASLGILLVGFHFDLLAS
jgi:hypothetical protein